MSKKILITDELFILPDHEMALRQAGFTELLRLKEVMASEETLCEAIKGAAGYILGGIEQVSARVIAAGAPTLRAIAFTGSGYRDFIPGYEEATARGIKITNAPGANAPAVAEFTIALTLSMVRRLPDFNRPGGLSFWEAPDFGDLTVAIVGYGEVGSRVARMFRALGFNVVVVAANGPNVELDGFERVNVSELPARANVISLHVSKPRGEAVLDRELISLLASGTIVVNAAFPDAVDQEALAARVRLGELFVAFDAPMEVADKNFPAGRYIESNAQTGFHTKRAIKRTSDMVTTSIINVLTTGDDTHLVN